MKTLRFVLMCAAALSLLMLAHPVRPVQAQDKIPQGCEAMNNPIIDGLTQTIVTTPFAWHAGDTLLFAATTPSAGGVITSIYLEVGGVKVQTATFPGKLTYTFPAAVKTTLEWGINDGTINSLQVTWTISCQAKPLIPGPEMGMPISATSVMGRFLVPAEAYWAPGQPDTRVVTLPAGQTAWVLGRDKSGAYYQIVWNASLLWVPVETMGPNFDALWQGRALPTEVVE